MSKLSNKKIKLLAAQVLIGQTTIDAISHIYGDSVANQVEAIINGQN